MGPAETVRGEVVEVADHGGSRQRERVVFDLRGEETSAEPEMPVTASAPGPTPEPEVSTGPSRSLAGRVAVVSGGASGVGRRVALELAAAGARVCVLGNDVGELRRTVEGAGPDAAMVFLQCDVGSLTELDGVVDFINRFDRPVDLVVHAEHVRVAGSIGTGSVHDLDEQYLINVRAPFLFTQRLLPRLREANGRVVFVTAEANDHEFGQHQVIAASVRALADGLRAEAGDDISVSLVVTAGAEVDDESLAAAVVQVSTLPDRVEIGDVRLRVRSESSGVRRSD